MEIYKDNEEIKQLARERKQREEAKQAYLLKQEALKQEKANKDRVKTIDGALAKARRILHRKCGYNTLMLEDSIIDKLKSEFDAIDNINIMKLNKTTVLDEYVVNTLNYLYHTDKDFSNRVDLDMQIADQALQKKLRDEQERVELERKREEYRQMEEKRAEEERRLAQEKIRKATIIFNNKIIPKIKEFLHNNYGKRLLKFEDRIINDIKKNMLEDKNSSNLVLNNRLNDDNLEYIIKSTVGRLRYSDYYIGNAIKEDNAEKERQNKIIQFKNNYDKHWGNHEIQHNNLRKALGLKDKLPNYINDTSARVISMITDLEAAKLLNTDTQPDNIVAYKKLVEYTKDRIFKERGNKRVNKTKLYQLFDE